MKVGKYVELHFIILLWGFTPVLGKLITLNAFELVWYRLLFSAISLYVYIRFKGISLRISHKDLLEIFLTGIVVGIHWFFFYHAIKVSNVSVALAGFSTITLFGSLMQPVILGKKFQQIDLIYGIVLALGLLIILHFEEFSLRGIMYGIIAAVTGAFFGVYNGKLIIKNNASVITLYEFLGALFVISIVKIFYSGNYFIAVGLSDIGWLLVLSILCTTVAFTMSMNILKYFSPLTVIITNNLEPVYGIFFSLLIFGESEYMSAGFYVGAAIILTSVFTYPILSKRFAQE